MKKIRKEEIITKSYNVPPHMVGNGFRVRQYVPGRQNLQERFSPFILLDYNEPFHFPPSDKVKGVGPHPHKGFETVTINLAGKIEHNDNKGNHGILEPGDVQWMTAGKGILHKEYHEKEFSRTGGLFHMIQLWVNLPREYKNTEPKYQNLLKDGMGVREIKNAKVTVIAGKAFETEGPAETFTPMNIYSVDLDKNSSIDIDEPEEFNTGLIVVGGELKINGTLYTENDFIIFENNEGVIELETLSENSKIIVLSGKPINEPIVSYGPFVMNTQEEITQAFEDFKNGKFGDTDF